MNAIIRLFLGKRSLLIVGLAVGFMTGPSQAGEINTGYFGGVAIEGYDPVAYFTEGRPMKGSEEFAHEWLGAEWHFANAEHRDLFAASPLKYAPQYGGHCADGVAYGQATANIDPTAWSIIEGKLYLNYDPGAKQEFEEVEGMKDRADANWREIKARLAQQ
ncbi:MAG: YHS domain-containing (seleno)protein [Gammaproteobacteria bacterium]